MKNLTVPQAVVIVVLLLVVGALTYFGAIPKDVIAIVVAWLIPSPIQPVQPAKTDGGA